jgi:hypothetical protein
MSLGLEAMRLSMRYKFTTEFVSHERSLQTGSNCCTSASNSGGDLNGAAAQEQRKSKVRFFNTRDLHSRTSQLSSIKITKN